MRRPPLRMVTVVAIEAVVATTAIVVRRIEAIVATTATPENINLLLQ